MADNTFDFIDNRFFHQKVKVPKVICTKHVQEIGDLIIPAPSGITLDVNTGLLNVIVSLELARTPQLRNVSLLSGKVINQGVVPVRLLVDNKVVIKLLEIPFQGIVECPGVAPGDFVQNHDVQVEGFSVSSVQLLAVDGVTLTLNLILKVVLEMCISVASERILKVNAAELFCP